MEFAHGRSMGCNSNSSSSSSGRVPAIGEEVEDLRRGPWTVDEDLVLVNYITNHGEGRWNLLARAAGLKRTGKSCRLRWLNYLRPDVRRGNITPEEQLLILQLHFRWGNRWSKIAQHLPGRTDNEIKNYWRTRVQKHAKQLRCDVSSRQFKDVMQHVWVPRLLERIRASAATTAAATIPEIQELPVQFMFSPERSLTGSSSESVVTTQFSSPPVSDLTGLGGGESNCGDVVQANAGFDEFNGMLDFGSEWGGNVIPDNFWGVDDIWSSLQQQQQL